MNLFLIQYNSGTTYEPENEVCLAWATNELDAARLAVNPDTDIAQDTMIYVWHIDTSIPANPCDIVLSSPIYAISFGDLHKPLCATQIAMLRAVLDQLRPRLGHPNINHAMQLIHSAIDNLA